MCGIFAAKNLNDDGRLNSTLMYRLSFRGPDFQSGLISFRGWSLYHARLTVLSDSKLANQPYFAEDGSVLLFNGEILNFKELQQVHLDQTNIDSDTVVLARLLSLDKFDLEELEGFFAFIRIDANGELTHAVRDPFGVKPLYYFEDGDQQIFCSEPSVISDLQNLRYNPQALDEYRVFRAPIFTQSYFDQVCQVLPGTCVRGGRYFDPRAEMARVAHRSTEAASEDLRDTVCHSVKQRLISDFPVAVLFSGGIDSNLIRAFVPDGTKFLTGGVIGPSYDKDYAEAEADKGLDVDILEIESSQFLDRWKTMVAMRKEPLSVPNEVIISFLGQQWADQGGKVLLSGEGADEFFGGYDKIFDWAGSVQKLNAREFLKRYAYVDLESIPEWIVQSVDEYFSDINDLNPFNMVRLFFVQHHMPVLFRRLDFALMFAGIEGREPLASKAIFRAAIRFGYDNCLQGGLGKIPLRRLAERIYSNDFAFRKKEGFPIDVKKIVTGEEAQNNKDSYAYWIEKNLDLVK